MMLLRKRLLGLLLVVVLLGTALGPVSNVAAAETDDLWDVLQRVIDLIEVYHKDEVDRETLLRGAIRGAVEALDDPHSAYMDADEYARFMEGLEERTFTGIGAFIEKQGRYIIVLAPIKGSPAEAAGLRPGDRILAVDGTSLLDVPVEFAVSLIRGPAASVVRLDMERPGEGRRFTVEIERAWIEVPTIEYELLADDIGYVKLYQFASGAEQKFRQAAQSLIQAGAEVIIFDLRQNPGGYLHVAVQIAGSFLDQGQPVLHTVGRGERLQTHVSPGGKLPVRWVVLVDRSSASASELLAGAIQDHGAAVIVGETTFGKGTVQQLFTLWQGGGLKVTTDEYLTPNRRRVEEDGITPDVVVLRREFSEEEMPALEFERLYRPGSGGVQILALQERLHFLGYYNGPQNAWYNPVFYLAVHQFQVDAGLAASGMIDRATLTAINAAVAAEMERLRYHDVQLERALEIARELLSEPVGVPSSAE